MTSAERHIDPTKPDQQPSTYLTVDELAELLRTPAGTLRYWRHLGKGPPSFRFGRRVLYDRRDVEAYIAQLRRTQAR